MCAIPFASTASVKRSVFPALLSVLFPHPPTPTNNPPGLSAHTHWGHDSTNHHPKFSPCNPSFIALTDWDIWESPVLTLVLFLVSGFRQSFSLQSLARFWRLTISRPPSSCPQTSFLHRLPQEHNRGWSVYLIDVFSGFLLWYVAWNLPFALPPAQPSGSLPHTTHTHTTYTSTPCTTLNEPLIDG